MMSAPIVNATAPTSDTFALPVFTSAEIGPQRGISTCATVTSKDVPLLVSVA
jgi:hypothetical protein